MTAETTEGGGFEVAEPILNSPFAEPKEHWLLEDGKPPVRMPGRRRAGYWYRDPKAAKDDAGSTRGVWTEMPLVNTIRDRMKEWRGQGRPGVTRTTADLFAHWTREGRAQRLLFAQLEAAETVIFLAEARADFLQGIDIPRDEPSEDRKAQGYAGFRRQCCKMATGSGKTTVMGLLAAWSILNKVANRSDARFSDTVLVVCPSVTIRSRLAELDPFRDEASLYRSRDLVPAHQMPDLKKGAVIIRNWHVFEAQSPNGGGARVSRAGVPETTTEWVTIAAKTTTARGGRYMTPAAYEAGVAAGQFEELERELNPDSTMKRARIRSTRYVESDTALVQRVLGAAKGKQNILVLNDEAHHAYRIQPKAGEEPDEDVDPDEEEEDEIDRKEATVWIAGLDKASKVRGINLCVDVSATPYFLGRVGPTNSVFPWVVSEFGLVDAIESGLTKIPQLVVRGPSGQTFESYFNIWRWILTKLTPAERGAKRTSPKPEAILKYANTPIAMLAGLWDAELTKLAEGDDPRPPVFILVCKNKRIAKAVYDWIGEDVKPAAIPSLGVPALKNAPDKIVTIRVDTSVVHETDSGHAKSDETAWMRHTLDTVGKLDWVYDSQGRPVYPEGFAELAEKLNRPLHPPGRDVRCIVSVGMLTEGWDCNTVSHVIGLRPFQSQLLCEQVVGRALRRRSYTPGEDDKFEEEVAKVFGVPFEIIPFKSAGPNQRPRPSQKRIYAVPEKAQFEITFPRVRGYVQGIRNRIAIPDWEHVPSLVLDPKKIPPEVEMAANLPTNTGRPSIFAPGGLTNVSLQEFRAKHRVQALVFDMARDLTRAYVQQATCQAPAHVLFPQIVRMVERYVAEKVRPEAPAQTIDTFISPYYGWVIERLVGAIKPDAAGGEAPELPDIERDRPGRTGDINAWTGREVYIVKHSHVNAVVADTQQWEQSAAYHIDTHPAVAAFVKNFGLNFTIPYFDNGQDHDYLPDFLIRLKGVPKRHLIVEIKGADWDGKTEIKKAAALRWCEAVNAAGTFGRWDYALVRKVGDVIGVLDGTHAA